MRFELFERDEFVEDDSPPTFCAEADDVGVGVGHGWIEAVEESGEAEAEEEEEEEEGANGDEARKDSSFSKRNTSNR